MRTLPFAVVALLDGGADPLISNPRLEGVTALLLARGCDLNHRDNDGMMALFWARYHEFPEIAQAIEDAGGVE